MSKSLEQLISSYRAEAINHGKGTLEGNSKFTNRSHDALISHLKSIKDYPEGPIELMKLLDDPDDSVASWAAAHLLKFCNQQSLETLHRLSSRSDLIGFSSKMVIREWENGRLKAEDW